MRWPICGLMEKKKGVGDRVISEDLSNNCDTGPGVCGIKPFFLTVRNVLLHRPCCCDCCPLLFSKTKKNTIENYIENYTGNIAMIPNLWYMFAWGGRYV